MSITIEMEFSVLSTDNGFYLKNKLVNEKKA